MKAFSHAPGRKPSSFMLHPFLLRRDGIVRLSALEHEQLEKNARPNVIPVTVGSAGRA
jgi:hypothetical protein